jgi:hypothetical protein
MTSHVRRGNEIVSRSARNEPETEQAQRLRSRCDYTESHRDLISLFEHDLFGKPVSTFPDHALGDGGQWSSIDARGKIHADDRGSDQSSKPPRWIATRDKHVAACPDDADSREAH